MSTSLCFFYTGCPFWHNPPISSQAWDQHWACTGWCNPPVAGLVPWTVIKPGLWWWECRILSRWTTRDNMSLCRYTKNLSRYTVLQTKHFWGCRRWKWLILWNGCWSDSCWNNILGLQSSENIDEHIVLTFPHFIYFTWWTSLYMSNCRKKRKPSFWWCSTKWSASLFLVSHHQLVSPTALGALCGTANEGLLFFVISLCIYIHWPLAPTI